MAALEQVLAIIATGREDEIPVFRMLRTGGHRPSRAQRLSEDDRRELEGARVVRCQSTVGADRCRGRSWRRGGPDPGRRAGLRGPLRTGTPAAFARVADRFVLLDCRTVTDEQVPHLARAVLYAIEGDEAHAHDLHDDEEEDEEDEDGSMAAPEEEPLG